MTGMIERVARAMFVADCDGQTNARDAAWELTHEGEREAYRALARAALTALREPSADMGLAMLDQIEPGSMPRSMPVCRMFTAAINAALSEGEG